MFHHIFLIHPCLHIILFIYWTCINVQVEIQLWPPHPDSLTPFISLYPFIHTFIPKPVCPLFAFYGSCWIIYPVYLSLVTSKSNTKYTTVVCSLIQHPTMFCISCQVNVKLLNAPITDFLNHFVTMSDGTPTWRQHFLSNVEPFWLFYIRAFCISFCVLALLTGLKWAGSLGQR